MKILLLQAFNNLADDRTEFLINDPLSFKRVDAKHKLIREAETTTASLHDSRKFEDIPAPASARAEAEENEVYADSAYRSKETEANLAQAGLKSQGHERAYKT